MLNIKRTGADDFPRTMKVLVCGEPGSGKTLFSSTFPNPLIVSAEGGLMSIADRDLHYTTIANAADLYELKKLLEQPASPRAKLLGFPVETLVIDTIDEVSRILLRERVAKGKLDTATIGDYGDLKQQLTRICTSLRNLDIHVVFTCHLKNRELEGVRDLIPGIEGGFSTEIAGYVDLSVVLGSRRVPKVIGQTTEKVTERFLQTAPDPPYGFLKDRSNRVPDGFPINFVDDFDRLAGYVWPGDPPSAVSRPETRIVDLSDVPVEAETAPAPQESVPAFTCASCGAGVDEDQHDRAQIKYSTPLCLPCFNAKGQK